MHPAGTLLLTEHLADPFLLCRDGTVREAIFIFDTARPATKECIVVSMEQHRPQLFPLLHYQACHITAVYGRENRLKVKRDEQKAEAEQAEKDALHQKACTLTYNMPTS